MLGNYQKNETHYYGKIERIVRWWKGMKEYGYVRVSSLDQNEERQMVEMRKIGITEDRIYKDKQSGKDFNRPMYQKLLWRLKKVMFSIF